MANALTIQINLPSDAEIKRMFDAVPLLRKHDVSGAVVREGAKAIAKQAKIEAPRSNPADTRKQSKSHRDKWGVAVKLHTTIGYVVRKGKRGMSYAIIGPKFPDGNKAYLNQPRERSRKHMLWGHDRGRTYVARRNWILVAAERSRGSQIAGITKVMKQKMSEMWLHV